ncbi:transglycosylase SLT domain-containing protein [Pannonibacter sp. SL95]|nr:transglycosylase SLT domain-containing protein [Pannonibacter sp. SL95]MCY1705563.1 transglycosylase SLT domain-containing protein [Pannonibacter sp. SL95]
MREVLVEDDSGLLRPALRPVDEAVPAALLLPRKGKGSSASGSETGSPSRSSRVRFEDLIEDAAAKHGVPLALAHAVIRVESNYNPGARGSAGEVGLMQIKPATARGLGYRGSVRALYDPATNLEWGMRYLAAAHKLASGDTCGTILRYNAGHFAKRMNPTSKRYCGKVKVILASA